MFCGTYRASASSPYRHWPLFIGAIGPDVRLGYGYWRNWRRACGFEVSVFGRSVYVGWGH